MKLSLSLSHRAALDRLTKFAIRFSRRHGLPDDERARLLVIFDELLTNVATYGYEGAADDGHIEASLSLDGDRLTIEFVDDGRPFDPLLKSPPPDVNLPLAERPIGGMGIAIIRALVDEIGYTRDGNRNRLTLGRAIQRPAGEGIDAGARSD